MSAFRPLPPRPNLEHARKEAKALLRRLRRGDLDAITLARQRHPALEKVEPELIRLSDAQLIIARDYGFASWPRLVRYFADVARQQYGFHQLHGGPDQQENTARSILANHEKGRLWATRTLAAYVPRFYGLSAEALSGVEATEEEGRLAAARMFGAPSWEVLLERIAHNGRNRPGLWESDAGQEARIAIRDGDLVKLKALVASQPDLLDPSGYELSINATLMAAAIWKEQSDGKEAARPIIEWLESLGFDRQLELNWMLRGHIYQRANEVQALLDLGADPSWVAPSGIPILEIALLRYWNPEAVDLLASRTTPRRALWIAAALGDIEGMDRFFDGNGRLKRKAGEPRPDWVAAGMPGPMALPEPDDEELLFEALAVAVFNARGPVIEYLVARGAPANSLAYSQPLLNPAIGNGWEEAATSLIRAGADLDVRGWHPDITPREAARQALERSPDSEKARRIAALCGLEVPAIVAGAATHASPEPYQTPEVTRALSAAADDASVLGLEMVGSENLLIGLLRTSRPAIQVLRESGLAVERFRADFRTRLDPPTPNGTPPSLPPDADARARLDEAISMTVGKPNPAMIGNHLLAAISARQEDPANRLLRGYGVDTAKLAENLGSSK